MKTRHHWHTYYRNRLSIFGFAVAASAGISHLWILALDFTQGVHNPYLSILLNLALPPFVVGGAAIGFFGAWRRRRRILKHGLPPEVVSVGKGRKGLLYGAGFALLLLLPFFGLTSYSGYHFTDSVEFCGTVCHVPMNPVFTAYQESPHARVACAECHIGEGASWFVRSKLSGTRQVFATLFDDFHRPIETPIRDLRPARETCERCHWPEMAFGSRVVELPHYATDEENSARPLSMVLHTGGGNPERSSVRGIHWHSIAANQVEYVSTDRQRLEIPWVRATIDGESIVYRSDGLDGEAAPSGEGRAMDCLDCHNRPSHHYRPPDRLLNDLLARGRLSPSLPFLKREAARLMAEPYPDTAAARTAIAAGLRGFYAENYPEIGSGETVAIDRAIEEVTSAYEKNFFPEMKTDWRTHPDHIGHKYSPGCFRCHDGEHVAADGRSIRSDCALCHDFLEHEEREGRRVLVQEDYSHPFELQGAHTELRCDACHDGGPTPAPRCDACHEEVGAFLAGRLLGDATVTGDPDPHFGELECIDCHDEQQRFEGDEILTLCADCHDEDEFELPPAERLRAVEEARAGSTNQDLLDTLDRIRAVHNLGFARSALESSGS